MTDTGTYKKNGNKQKRLNDMFNKKSFEEVGQSICKWMVANGISWLASKSELFQPIMDTTVEHSLRIRALTPYQLSTTFLD